MDEVVSMLSYFAKRVMTVDMFPFFFLADFSINTLLVRNDSGHLGPKFRQKHPFASWFSTIVTCLSGAFVASFLFGDSVLNILQENTLILFLTLIWYLVNYSPYDIVYKVLMQSGILFPACLVQECVRLRFVYLGVQAAAQVYPNAPLIIMMGGIIKGNGYGFIKVVERLIRGLWNPKSNEILEVSYFTKSGVIGSLLFLLHHYKVLNIQIEFLYLGVLIAFIVGRLILVLGGLSDPLAPVDSQICRLLFGGWEEEKPGRLEPKENKNKGDGDVNRNNNDTNNNKKKSGNAKRHGSKKKD